MKIRGMEIARWRNVPDLTIEPDADTDFVCLVGVNGVGKSKSAGADRLASSTCLGPESVLKVAAAIPAQGALRRSPEAPSKGWNRPLLWGARNVIAGLCETTLPTTPYIGVGDMH